MNMMTVTQGNQPVSGGFCVALSRGQRIGRVSSEWFTRPDDEHFLSLSDLYEAVRGRAERAQARTVESRAIRVEANRDSSERLALMVPGPDEQVMPTNWGFGQCARWSAPNLVFAAASRSLVSDKPAARRASHRAELVKVLEADNECVELRPSRITAASGITNWSAPS